MSYLEQAVTLLETCWNERRAPLYAEVSALRAAMPKRRYEIACGQMLPVEPPLAELDEELARIAELEAERDALLAEVLKITSWNNELVDEHATQVQQLKAELRQYQPSDGMMYKLLGLNDVIREAATLLRDIRQDANNAVEAGLVSPMTEHVEGQIDAWLKHPTVVRAVTSPLAQAKVKE